MLPKEETTNEWTAGAASAPQNSGWCLRPAASSGSGSILEDYMLDIMYEIPKDNNIGTVIITGDYIKKTGAPVIQMRGMEIPALTQQNG